MLGALMVAGLVSAQNTEKKGKETVKNNDKQTVEYSVNMDCQDCEKKITEQLRFEKGVLDLKTELKNKKVSVTYKVSKTDTAKLAKSIRKLGYTVGSYKAVKK